VAKLKSKRQVQRVPPRRWMGRRLMLDRALIQTIADAVGRGAFLHVAAEASGVSRRTLFGWLERGRELTDLAERGVGLDERESLYVELLEAVTMAHASARLKAEGVVFKREPLAWLRFGPGRDQGVDAPGWTRAMPELRQAAKSAAEEALAEALRQLGLAAPVSVTSTVEPVLVEGTARAESEGEDGGD
jgi:hypothetical protein